MVDLPTYKKRIANPNNGGQFVDLAISDEKVFRGMVRVKDAYEDGKWETSYENNENETRKVHVKTVNGSDNVSSVQVEAIEEWLKTHGSGPVFRRQYHIVENDPIAESRKTHKKKIYNGNNWIEVERTDELTIEFGSGPIFQRVILVVDWSNEDEYDGTDVSPGGGANGIDPPYRLDPWQMIVDVHWEDEDPDAENTEYVVHTGVGLDLRAFARFCSPTIGTISGNETRAIETAFLAGGAFLGAYTQMSSWILNAGPTILGSFTSTGSTAFDISDDSFATGIPTHTVPGEVLATPTGPSVNVSGRATALSGVYCAEGDTLETFGLSMYAGSLGGLEEVISRTLSWAGVTFQTNDSPPKFYVCHRAEVTDSVDGFGNPNPYSKGVAFIFRRTDSTLPP